MRIFESKQTEAAKNAGLEEWLYRAVPVAGESFLVYRNGPSVLIGRHQNPWRECAVPWCAEHGVAVVRRLSGGGAVYHDLGNLNMALMLRKERFAPKLLADLVMEWLRSRGVPAEIDGRSSVLVAGRKIFGSAFVVNSRSALMHGCLLVKAELERLRAALTPCGGGWSFQCDDVESVRKPVANLEEYLPGVEMDALKRSLVDAVAHRWGDGTGAEAPWQDVMPTEVAAAEEFACKFRSMEWTFERTASFALLRKEAGWEKRLDVCGGIVVSAQERTARECREMAGFSGKSLRGLDRELFSCYLYGNS